jgi:hypothetical protein
MGDARAQDRIGGIEAGAVGRQRRRTAALAEAVGGEVHIGEIGERLEDGPAQVKIIADLAIDLGGAGIVAAAELIAEAREADAAVGGDIAQV